MPRYVQGKCLAERLSQNAPSFGRCLLVPDDNEAQVGMVVEACVLSVLFQRARDIDSRGDDGRFH